MAMVQCGECGKNVSDKALMCPHCGRDVRALQAMGCRCYNCDYYGDTDYGFCQYGTDKYPCLKYKAGYDNLD